MVGLVQVNAADFDVSATPYELPITIPAGCSILHVYISNCAVGPNDLISVGWNSDADNIIPPQHPKWQIAEMLLAKSPLVVGETDTKIYVKCSNAATVGKGIIAFNYQEP